MPMGVVHDAKGVLNEVVRDFLEKKVAHGIYKDNLRLFPGERESKGINMNGRRKTLAIFGNAHLF